MRGSPLFIVAYLTAILVGIGGMVTFIPTHADMERYFSPATLHASVVCENGPERVVYPADVDYYAQLWRGAGEPSLYQASLRTEAQSHRTYRFSITDLGYLMIVRLEEREPGVFRMTAKRRAPSSIGADELHVERTLTRDEAQAILALIAKTQAMSLQQANCSLGAHGNRWTFEGIEGGQLHYVRRQSLSSGPIHELGMAFLALPAWTLELRM